MYWDRFLPSVKQLRTSTSNSEVVVLNEEKSGLPPPDQRRNLRILGLHWMEHETDRLIGAVTPVMHLLYQSVTVKKELRQKEKLLIYRSL